MKTKYVAFIIFLLFAMNLFSQGLYFGPQLGIYKSKDADDSSFLYGGSLRLKLLPILGIEGAINYRQEKYFHDQVTVKTWPIQATAMIYPMPILYAAVGMGWYNVTIDYKSHLLDDQTDQQTGWHFGGGVELPLGPKAKLAGDIRYVFLDYEWDDGLPGTGDVESNFYVITAALLFKL